MDIESIRELSSPCKPFPIDDAVILKLPVGTDIVFVGNQIFQVNGSPVYNSSKEFIDKLTSLIRDKSSPKLLCQGIDIEILEPEKKWITGKFRLGLVVEFIPDGNAVLNGNARPRSTDAVLGGE